MGNRRYGALFTCDPWKSRNSMRLVGVFTLLELKKQIKERVESKCFEFEDKEEIKDMDFEELAEKLEFGYIEILHINEEL